MANSSYNKKSEIKLIYDFFHMLPFFSFYSQKAQKKRSHHSSFTTPHLFVNFIFNLQKNSFIYFFLHKELNMYFPSLFVRQRITVGKKG